MKVLMWTGILFIGLSSVGFAADPAPKAPAAAVPAASVQQPGMKTIFDYQQEVGLTDAQMAEMQRIMTDLQSTLNGKVKELTGLRQSLSEMIAKKDNMKNIKAQMQKIANMQVDNSCLDIEASRKVEKVMKPEQIAQWKDIQKKFAEEMMAAQQAAQPSEVKK